MNLEQCTDYLLVELYLLNLLNFLKKSFYQTIMFNFECAEKGVSPPPLSRINVKMNKNYVVTKLFLYNHTSQVSVNIYEIQNSFQH